MLTPVEAFLGVPYASPPTNTLRFMPPVTSTYWRGIRLANRFGPVCPQNVPYINNTTESLKKMSNSRFEYLKRVVTFLRNQSEDCLYLNLYVPYNNPLPSQQQSSSSSSPPLPTATSSPSQNSNPSSTSK